MPSELVINVTSQETRIALIENGILAELFIERRSEKGIGGNIYKGRVVRVLPGMQAAFVDIDLDRSAFLYVDDVYEDYDYLELMMGGSRENGDVSLEIDRKDTLAPSRYSLQIEDMLHEGQEVLVQVSKEPIGSKGARVTAHISLPGRYLVFMPTVDHIGVSRRIEDEGERKRLKEIVSRIKPPEVGFIVRTASEGRTEEDLLMDLNFLLKLWERVQHKKVNAPVPSIIHSDLDICLRAIRDLYTKDVGKVVVDSAKEYNELIEFIETFIPQLKYSIEFYEAEEPIFDAYGIEVEISRALGRKVWLKSGGYIVIEETEALTAVDVNTGKYVGKGNPEDTILKTNLEAVKEIAYQLRLRNIGGIIIIDFIDMEREGGRERVFQTLYEALKKDRAKTNILRISELGLVEMTRKRTRENLSRILCESCSYCEGKGVIKSKTTLCFEIFREIRREAMNVPSNMIIVSLHPEVADFLYDEERYAIEELEDKLKKKIIIKVRSSFHQEEYEIESR
ncbi:MAG: Rne/Rng family ribonuclease [Deltaproteobacteria bacterium]|nr:Rne/Rng family ribonuclease [Deltaproteobacteria bacterium]